MSTNYTDQLSRIGPLFLSRRIIVTPLAQGGSGVRLIEYVKHRTKICQAD